MKKLYIVTAVALCAVLSVEAKPKCKGGQCGMPKKTTIFKPTPRPVVTAPAVSTVAAWTAPKLGHGTESSAKITMDITASIADLEAKLKGYRAQLKGLEESGTSSGNILGLREKIKAAEVELAILKKMQSCVK